MMALDNNYLLSPQQPFPFPSLDWDPHSLPFGLALGGVHELNTSILPPVSPDTGSPMSSEASTGYLQDAVACKRRRLASSPLGASFMNEDIQELFQWHGFWDSTCYGDPLGNLNCLVEDTSNASGDIQNCSSQDRPVTATSDRKDSRTSTDRKRFLAGEELEQGEEEKRRKMRKKVVYPFAMLKPAGVEGDATLADINERVLMRPARPVRHPVGEFAFGPCVPSANGPGLSGKAVVGLTRIHTKGRGTVTIIRTRG